MFSAVTFNVMLSCRSGARGGRGGASGRGGRGRGGGRGGRSRQPPPSADSLDAELDAYRNKVDIVIFV